MELTVNTINTINISWKSRSIFRFIATATNVYFMGKFHAILFWKNVVIRVLM